MEHPELKTKRLLLRRFRAADASHIQNMAGNFNVAKMTLNIPHPYEDGLAEIWISEHQKKMSAGTQLTYAITDIGDRVLFGAISLTEIQNDEANLGYWLGQQHWAKGYCSEAAMQMVTYAFRELELQRICSQHLTVNPASGRVMIKIGMEHIKSRIVAGRNGEPVRMELYEAERS